jgi:hypothetical protein
VRRARSTLLLRRSLTTRMLLRRARSTLMRLLRTRSALLRRRSLTTLMLLRRARSTLMLLLRTRSALLRRTRPALLRRTRSALRGPGPPLLRSTVLGRAGRLRRLALVDGLDGEAGAAQRREAVGREGDGGGRPRPSAEPQPIAPRALVAVGVADEV